MIVDIKESKLQRSKNHSKFKDSIKLIKIQYNQLKTWINEHKLKVKTKGKAHFTFMLIPHSDLKTITLSISYKSITTFFIILTFLIFLSSFVLLRFSGMDHELNELNISNEDYIILSKKLKSEMKVLHELSSLYHEKISNLYIKLGGDTEKIYPKNKNEIISYLEPNSDVFPETYLLQTDIYNLKLANQLTKEIIRIIKDKNTIIQNTPSLWPTKGYILYPYGEYFSPIAGGNVINYGIDIGTFPGTEVVATAPGEVYDIGYSYHAGYYIKIAHKYGWKTIYSNLERVQVKKNQIVVKGETIGFAGKTVLNPIYLLHYEVHVGTSPLNPHSFLNQVQN
jgi:murein DD-endopeptidase MepM/ murein hydrolase activator NlpD